MAHQNLAAAAMVQQYVANLDPSVQKLLQLLYDSHVELENKLAKKAEEYNKLLQAHARTKKELQELSELVSKHLPMLRHRLNAVAAHPKGIQLQGRPEPAHNGSNGPAAAQNPVSEAMQPAGAAQHPKNAKRQLSADAGMQEGRISTHGDKASKRANNRGAMPSSSSSDEAIAAAIAAAAAATQEALAQTAGRGMSALAPGTYTLGASGSPRGAPKQPACANKHLQGAASSAQGGAGAAGIQHKMVGSGMEAGLDGAALLEFFAAHGSLANTHAAQQPQPTNAYPPAQPGAAQHTPQVSAPAELDASAMCAVVVAFLQQQTNSKAQDRSSSGEGAAGMVNGSDGGSDASGFHPAAAAAGVAAGTGLQQHDSQQLVG